MSRRLATASVLAVALLALTPAARAGTQTVTIASFNYTPSDVRINVGDTVEWRNLDPTVHTVTASRGEFNSGSMRQGQRFRATFNQPGVYQYFCEPHETMQALVSVTGAATPTPTTAATTTTTTLVSATRGPGITATTPAPAPPTTVVALAPAPAEAPVASARPVAVVAGAVTGDADQGSPVLPLLALVGVLAAWLGARRRFGVRFGDSLRYAAAAATAATGALHLQLRVALAYPEPIGTLLVIEAAGAAVLTTWLLARPLTRRTQLAAIGAHLAALAALAITRTGVGLFGFHEIGWDPSPQVPLAVTLGVIAVALLTAARPDR